MRLLVTADLHLNHAKSRALALEAIEQINQTPADVLLLIGDTAAGDGPELEEALSAIRFDGPKLFLAGNHELWTKRGDSQALFEQELPRRVRELGWQWLEEAPFERDGVAIVGSIGWYDYAYAPDELGIPRRFYEAKVSPGAAERLSEHQHLLGDDVPAEARDVVARWNDGRFIRLDQSDDDFLQGCLERLSRALEAVEGASRVVAAVHHVPFPELLPPRHSATWDFARAYLGSPQLGVLLRQDPRVTHVLCGHSHFPADVRLGPLRAVNIGSGYRQKRVLTLDL